MDPVNIPAKFEVRSFTRSWDNRGYSKKFGQSLDTPTLPFLQNFSWACVRMDPVNGSAKFAVRSFSHQRHRQTDGRHAISIPRYALVHRAVITWLYVCLRWVDLKSEALLLRNNRQRLPVGQRVVYLFVLYPPLHAPVIRWPHVRVFPSPRHPAAMLQSVRVISSLSVSG